MRPLTDHTPKPLLPVRGTTVVELLVGQLLAHGADVSVVVGHEAARVSGAIRASFGEEVKIVENMCYEQDVNILSLTLALGEDDSAFTVFEADCLFDDASMQAIWAPDLTAYSSWFTIGDFRPPQVGGILKAGDDGWVKEVKIVKEYQNCYHDYRKLIGVLKVGPREAPEFVRLLRLAVAANTKQYYLMPWIENIERLPCRETDLRAYRNGAFNSPEEYLDIVNLFR